MEIIEKTGVMASITWNSNRWMDKPTHEDLTSSKYDHVRDYQEAHESLNFAHQKLPSEKGGWFIGYSPILKDRLPSKKHQIKVLFLISTDHAGDKRRYVVGIYGFPQFAPWFDRTQRLHPLYRRYDGGTFRSKVEDIILLDHYLPIDNVSVQALGLLPAGKKISQQGWNYLNSNNVENLLQYALSKNPHHTGLKSLMQKMGISENDVMDAEAPDINESDADTLAGIAALESRAKNATPEKKDRISTCIERGTIARQVKKLTGYRCLVCAALGMNPIGFPDKDTGKPYVEAHHVVPVARQEKGSLSITNIITVCANHHRQFHHGRVKDLAHTNHAFHFDFDGNVIAINKIQVEERSMTATKK